ncbi:MAG: APC family permease [Candidatus Nanohaloarchaea archaeon]|nr:APC family permease [Candidatus Nanohaloarchaea archaeon]
MSEEKLGLKEVIAMGVGGMVSGGIYAVLGVAMKQAGNAVPLSFLLAGILTLLTAYSYVKLTCHFKEKGGAFSYIEHVVANRHIAGIFGWILVIGYIGVMAMYAFAFGSYTLVAMREIFSVALPQFLRPLISISIMAVFIGLNIYGVKESGLYEDIAVYIKIFILLSLAGLGIYFFQGDPAGLSFFNKGYTSPVTAFAIIFVAYEGFQLLIYDYADIQDADRNLARGMFIAIFTAILIYVSISYMATLHLTPQMLIQHKETALAKAVSETPILGTAGFILVIVSALKSTSSGINATLFGSSRLTHKIATEKELPRIFSFRDKRGIPVYSLLIIGGASAIFAALGTLEQITEFGSIAFLLADGAANYANLRLYRETDSNPLIPALGLLGVLAAFPIVVYHLYLTQFQTLAGIGVIFVLILYIEFIHMERKPLKKALHRVEEKI